MFNFNPAKLKIEYKVYLKDEHTQMEVWYDGIRLKKIGQSCRHVFQLDKDYVIKFDACHSNHFHHNQCKMEKYTWDLICEKYPRIKKYVTPIYYYGEFGEGKHYIVTDYCKEADDPSELIKLKRNVKPFYFDADYYDDYQCGFNNQGKYVIYDYSINNFSMQHLNLDEL